MAKAKKTTSTDTTTAADKPKARPGNPGGKKGITDLEQRMLASGYASVRIVAAKTHVHQTTWHYRVRKGEVVLKTVANRAFISIESVRVCMGADAVKIFNLNDWSDVVLNGG